MPDLSIWDWVVTDDLDALFLALVRAPEDQFEAAAEPFLSCIPAPALPDAEDNLSEALANIEALKLPDETKREMIDGLRAAFEDDEENPDQDWDGDDPFEDEDDPSFEMASRREIPLATSHMFFDDPYASMEYEEIERQESECRLRYQAAVSRAVGATGESFAAYIGATEAMLNDDANYDFFERYSVGGFEWVWQTPDAVYYLVHDHEDKELPIHLSFGRASPDDFAALRGYIRETL